MYWKQSHDKFSNAMTAAKFEGTRQMVVEMAAKNKRTRIYQDA
jgi:hypothetical protein